MSNEIKETLEYKIDFLTKSLNIGIPTKDRRYFNDIKDCITNLQQEIQEMKTNTIPTLKHNIDALVDEVDELEDYKSRCEKAIKLINDLDIECNDDYDFYIMSSGVYCNPKIELLNILQGENNGN